MDPLPPLEELGEKISRAQKGAKPADKYDENGGFGLAFRIGTELVAGVLVGSAFGWMLDQWLETFPALFIVCFLLGSAAGGLTVYRTVVALEDKAEEKERENPPAPGR